jgi:hypothetical protein
MKSIHRFKAFENVSADPEVQAVITDFKNNPKKYFMDPVALKDLSDDELTEMAQKYLDFPFRLPPREEDIFTGR